MGVEVNFFASLSTNRIVPREKNSWLWTDPGQPDTKVLPGSYKKSNLRVDKSCTTVSRYFHGLKTVPCMDQKGDLTSYGLICEVRYFNDTSF